MLYVFQCIYNVKCDRYLNIYLNMYLFEYVLEYVFLEKFSFSHTYHLHCQARLLA